MPAVISVAEYLALINQALHTIPSEGFVVEGEVADFKVNQGQWVNFLLKDEKSDAKIGCFTTVYKLRVPLADGLRVQIRGYAKVNERWGKLSLNVESIELVGEGALAKAYAMLKEKLRVEGLFDIGRKRQLPYCPERVGLITSREAAAYGDFLRILGNRWGGVTVMHAHVHVQGQLAVDEILEAFALFNALPENERPSVLVLTRGGGSLEELHAFNDERVARAVFSSAIPVIVGVGHERDESLCDFVADFRASTPSNAAECLVPDRRELLRALTMSTDRMTSQLERMLERRSMRIDRAVQILDQSVDKQRERCRQTSQRLGHAFDRFRLSVVATIEHVNRRQTTVEQTFNFAVAHAKNSLQGAEKYLSSVDPLRVLSRGYAIVRKKGAVVRSPAELAPGERLSVQLAGGELGATVAENRTSQHRSYRTNKTYTEQPRLL